ncbi:MAG: hypothetical protein WC209_17675 [Ignavibacteriaceae bacterium]|jgi:hypothetical protein
MKINKLKPFILLLLTITYLGCIKVSEPVDEGFIDDKKPDELFASSHQKSKIQFNLTGTSKKVYLYYSSYSGIVRRANQTLPWSYIYYTNTDTTYYINVTNLNDSGYVALKIYRNDELIKTRSMEGFEANMKETGPTK